MVGMDLPNVPSQDPPPWPLVRQAGVVPRPTPKSTVDMSRSQSAERSSAGLGGLIGGGASQIDDVGLVGTGELILGVAGQAGLAG